MSGLIEYFDDAITTPEEVIKLKEIILQLAMQGKLVEQNPNDESGFDLVKRIEVEKERLIKEKKISKTGRLSDISNEEKPYLLPKTWVWKRLGDISTKITDGSHNPPKKETKGYPMISAKNIQDGEVDLKTVDRYINQESFIVENKRTNISYGDILLCIVGSIGKSAIYREKAKITAQRSVCVIDTLINNEFIQLYLNSPYSLKQMLEKASGTAQKGIYLQTVKELLVVVPPIQEQIRIVEKVKELFELCDALVFKFEEKEKRYKKLNQSVFSRLQDHRNPQQMNDLRFVIEEIEHLCNDNESVNQLRNAVLSLAVQGKLVEQNFNEERASVLIEKIKKEKVTMIAERMIKREKPLQPINPEEVPFPLPKGWEWVRLGEITTKLGAGKTPLGGQKNYVQEGVKFIRSQNVWNNGLWLEGVAHITPETNGSMSGSIVRPKDILLNITGASIGRSSLVPHDFDMANVNQHVAIIRLVDDRIRHYLHTCIISPYFQNEVMRVQVGASREGLSMTKLAKFVIPLPPIAEQVRIMDKVQSLFDLIEHYEKQVIMKEKSAKSLSDSLIENLLI